MIKYDSASPYIASFVILRRDNKIAMILRKNTGWMDGYFGLPSGKVEWGEPFSLAVIREAKEEVGVEISDTNQVHAMHRHSEDSDWVDVYFEVSSWIGEPYNAEPEKSEELRWLDINNLPDNVVPSQRSALEAIAKGEHYSEYGWE